jgi:hypothetical protein
MLSRGLARNFGIACLLATCVPVATADAASSPGITTMAALANFLVHSREMPGFVPSGNPHVETGASKYVKQIYGSTSGSERKLIHALNSAGFVAGASEILRSQKVGKQESAISSVLLFKTDKDAVQDEGAEYKRDVQGLPKGAVIQPFKVGLRTARAFSATGKNDVGGTSSVIFTSGQCVFIVGAFINGSKGDTASSVKAAAVAIYNGVTGACK